MMMFENIFPYSIFLFTKSVRHPQFNPLQFVMQIIREQETRNKKLPPPEKSIYQFLL